MTAAIDEETPGVRYEVDDHVATLTLDAPKRMNTISPQMPREICGRLIEADADHRVRAIVITGAGKAFCAGLDLQAQMAGPNGGLGSLSEGTSTSPPGEIGMRNAPPMVLHNIDTPTICALNSGAAGYGLVLALGCDIRLAADTAKLNSGLAKRGIAPESGDTWLLPRMVGYAKAAELAFMGRTIAAAEAFELGIVSQVIPAVVDRRFCRRRGSIYGKARS